MIDMYENIIVKQMDSKMRQFYRDMGYSDDKIKQAYQYSQQTGSDMLDILNLPQIPEPSQKVSVPVPSKDQPSDPRSNNYKNPSSFLTPWNKIKTNQFQMLFSRTNKHLQSNTKTELRQEDYPVGLLNVSNCCYLNSLLQCYFLMDDFKIAILTAEQMPNLDEVLANDSKTKVKRIKNEYELLKQFKSFFTTMALTSKRYLDPTSVLHNLVDSVGEKVSYGQEKDLSEINILITQRLSQGLMFTKNHYQSSQPQSLIDSNSQKEGSTIIEKQSKNVFNSIFNPKQGSIKKLFYGSRVQYYDDQTLQKEPPIVSDFTGLFLNPRGGNLYKSLDDQFSFEVQINGGLHRKTAFIRDEPEYLFIYINRADFDKEEGQALKNKHKFTFDFTVYLDRYLQKYRQEHGHSHERIKELLSTKNKIKEQVNHLQILFKKVQECEFYAQQLEGWLDRLPKEEQFQEEYDRLQLKLQSIQTQLDQIQSRKEQYHLMYIFVHRGDAVSGHYWGYGLNGQQWYRFDINTQPIEQDQIVIDLEKSSATPYALLYVKNKNLPKFQYKIYQDFNCLKEFKEDDFRCNLDSKMGGEIIGQNIALHQEMIVRQNKVIKNKVFTDYITRYNAVKKVTLRYNEQRQKDKRLSQLDIYNNFSLFLMSRAQKQLAKYTLFEQSVFSASTGKLTVQKLLHETELLHKIQKKFKKSCRGQNHLKFYSLLHKQIQKLTELYQSYQIGSFEIVWGAVTLNQAQFYQDQWVLEVANHPQQVFEPSPSLKNRIQRLCRLMAIRSNLLKTDQYKKAVKSISEPLFISQTNNQIAKLLMFSFATTGFKVDSLQQFIDISDQVGAQIAKINAGNLYVLDSKVQSKDSPIQAAANFVSRFNALIGKSKTNQQQSAKVTPNKMAEEKRMLQSSGFKNSFLSSPNKNSATRKKSSAKEEPLDHKIITELQQVLILQKKQSWKVEELDNAKINDEFKQRLLNFLKKLGALPKIYKKVLKEGNVLSLNELREGGLFVNQAEKVEKVEKVEQQSLI